MSYLEAHNIQHTLLWICARFLYDKKKRTTYNCKWWSADDDPPIAQEWCVVCGVGQWRWPSATVMFQPMSLLLSAYHIRHTILLICICTILLGSFQSPRSLRFQYKSNPNDDYWFAAMCSIFRVRRSNSNIWRKNVQNWTLAKRLALAVASSHCPFTRGLFFLFTHTEYNGCCGRISHPPLDTYRWAIFIHTSTSYIFHNFVLCFVFWLLSFFVCSIV